MSQYYEKILGAAQPYGGGEGDGAKQTCSLTL